MASITVTATGTAPVGLHTAQVHLYVEAHGATPAEALASLASRTQRLKGVLAARAVPDDAVGTQHLNVQPRHDPRRGVVDGTSAGTTVVVALPSIDDVPDLLHAVVEEGVLVQTVAQAASVTAEEESAARRAAVELVRSRAEELAAAAGGTLGPLLSLQEGGPPVGFGPRAFKASVAPMPVWEQGSSATVTVTAVYELVEPT